MVIVQIDRITCPMSLKEPPARELACPGQVLIADHRGSHRVRQNFSCRRTGRGRCRVQTGITAGPSISVSSR